MGKKTIKIYQSFEEQANADLKETLAQSPLQRLAETVELIKRVYNYNPGQKRPRKIIFTSGK